MTTKRKRKIHTITFSQQYVVQNVSFSQKVFIAVRVPLLSQKISID